MLLVGLPDNSGAMVSASDGALKPAQPVSGVIEKLGFGLFQIITSIAANGIWVCEGCLCLVISSAVHTLRDAWGLSPAQCGSIQAIVFVGAMLGNLASGWIGDRVGRRSPIIAAYLAMALFAMLISLSPNFLVLAFLLFCLGLAFGAGLPTALAFLIETCPVKCRGFNQGAFAVYFTLGELYCCLILSTDDPSLKTLNWQTLFFRGGLPAVAWCLFSYCVLCESPVYLAETDPVAGRGVLSAMRRWNCKGGVSIDFKPQPLIHKSRGDLSEVFGRHILWHTLVLCFTAVSFNFVAFGIMYALPQVLPQLPQVRIGTSVASQLSEGMVYELIGAFTGIIMSTYFPRKIAMSIYFAGTGISCVFFATAYAGGAHGTGMIDKLSWGLCGMKFFPNIGNIILYIYTSEMYPVLARTTGTSVVIATGRVGAILTSLAYEFLCDDGPQGMPHGAFFYTCSFLMVICMALFMTMPETRTWGGHCKADDLSVLAPLRGSAKIMGSAKTPYDPWIGQDY